MVILILEKDINLKVFRAPLMWILSRISYLNFRFVIWTGSNPPWNCTRLFPDTFFLFLLKNLTFVLEIKRFPFSFLTKRWPMVFLNRIFLTIDVKYNSVSTSNLIFSRTLISLINWRFWFDCLPSQSELSFFDFKSVFNKNLLNFFQILFWSWI